MTKVKLGKYQHYKGNLYQVLGIARNSENLNDIYVVYKPLYKSRIFGGKDTFCIRPKKMFMEDVEVNGNVVPRFKYLGKIT
jgi:hypothetical protein